MTTKVLDPNEILLNGVHYPTKGSIKPVMVSSLPGRVVVGDPSQSDEPVADAWVISDQRGGIGVHEMDEKVHKDRCAMSTCDLRFKGHNVLPRLVSEAKKPPADTAAISDASGNATWSNPANACDESTLTYASITLAAGQTSDYLQLTFAAHNAANIRIWVDKINVLAADTVSVEAYYDGTWNVEENDWANITDGGWTTIAIGATKSITGLQLKCTRDAGGAAEHVRVHEFITDGAESSIGAALAAVETFNAHLYFGIGANVWRLDETNKDRIYLLVTLDGTITDMVASHGNALYFAVGDATEYWFMSTTEAFTQNTQSVNGTFLTEWDSKLYITDSLGAISEISDPDAAGATETAKGSLADNGVADNDLTSLVTDADASGVTIIYAATKKGLFAHDYANTRWEQTELNLPNHPNGGKGCSKWREHLYISSGLDVARYIAAETAIIDFTVGLSRDDGLLTYNAGEIVKFIPSFNELFALVDSSQVSGVGYSSVMSWDGRGWQCAWEAASADDAMTTGIVSSVAAYRLWFDHDSKLYYMPLDRNLTNPKQKPLVHAYHAVSVHITPNFDADWKGNKIALAAELYTNNPGTSETITPYYRINYANTDRDTDWTALGSAITTSGLTTVEFGTYLGTAFKVIQFRWDLARSGTTTSTPDLIYFKLVYLRQPKIEWGYRIDIDASGDYRGKSPETLLDALRTATSATTLVTFYYNDVAHYVYVKSIGGEEATGSGESGAYSILLVEPY